MRMRLQHLDISFYFCNIHIRESNVFQYFPMHSVFSFTLGRIVGMFCSSILPSNHPHLLVWLSGCDMSVEKTSIPITADLASCKECPTRSDGTHTSPAAMVWSE